jgi:hypothetical protein
VLSELPVRALFFLRGVSNYGAIRSALAKVGFGEPEHNEGWALLSRAFSYGSFSAADGDLRAIAAQDEVDAWMSKHHDRFAIAVERLHPKHTNLFAETKASSSGQSPRDKARGRGLAGLSGLLDRLDAVQARAAKSQEDRAVLQTLARRGLDASERERLRAQLELAKRTDRFSDAETRQTQASDRARHEALLALYRWHVDWSGTAHRVIERKDQLIALGLVGRKRRDAAIPATSD